MMNNLLPARTGELSYVYLLKKVNNRTTGEGVATLVIARIFDFIALAILFFITILLLKDIPKIVMDALWIIAVFTIFLSGILLMLLWRGRIFVETVQKISEKIHIENERIISYLLQKGFESVNSFERIQIKKDSLFLIILSLATWALNFLMVYLLLVGMDFQFPFFLVILGGTFILLTTILPIQGIGGFGTTETIWTLVFVSLGMPLDDAITSGFCYHFILIIYFLILGLYGWVKLRKITDFSLLRQ